MTYDNQGRRLLSNPLWKDYEFAEPAKGHPSTWEAECKALWIAATNALHKLEQSRFSNAEHEQAKDILRKATTAPHSATPQREVERK